LKQGDALSPLVFNFALKYAIKRVKVNQDGLKLNGKLQVLVCAVDVDTVDESTHTIKNTEFLLILVASKEIVLEVNTDTT
jgi:hypothetical protein